MASLGAQLTAFGPRVCADPVSMPRRHENWTCGYENLAALLRSMAARAIPGVPATTLSPRGLQAHVESAWRAGFDPASVIGV